MTTSNAPEYWRKCTSCKSAIGFGQKYWVCSVSTCNRIRTALTFCKVSCFDAHVPVMNHKDAGALENRAPTLNEWLRDEKNAAEETSTPASRQSSPTPTARPSNENTKREILVVVSKTKDYVRAKAGINTSDSVMEALSDKIRVILDEAIRRALQDERKTLLDRDLR